MNLILKIRKHPRDAIMGGSLLLCAFSALCLATGLILDRIVIDPVVGLEVIVMMAWIYAVAFFSD